MCIILPSPFSSKGIVAVSSVCLYVHLNRYILFGAVMFNKNVDCEQERWPLLSVVNNNDNEKKQWVCNEII